MVAADADRARPDLGGRRPPGVRLSVRSDLALLTSSSGSCSRSRSPTPQGRAGSATRSPHVFSVVASPTGFSGDRIRRSVRRAGRRGVEAPAYSARRPSNRGGPCRGRSYDHGGDRRRLRRLLLRHDRRLGGPDVGKLAANPAPWDTLGRTLGGGPDGPGRRRRGRRPGGPRPGRPERRGADDVRAGPRGRLPAARPYAATVPHPRGRVTVCSWPRSRSGRLGLGFGPVPRLPRC